MAKSFVEHPEFMRVSKIANEAIAEAAQRLDCIDALHAYHPSTGRVVDDMTKLLLRAWDRDHK